MLAAIETIDPDKLAALKQELEDEGMRREIRRNTAAWAHYKGFRLAAHHRLIVDAMDDFIENPNLDVLLIHAPPGCGKSSYVSWLFPPRYFAEYPENNILFATHSANFAERWGRKVRNTIELDGSTLGIALSKTGAAADQFSLEQGGEYYGVGAGTGISGFRADLGICDDLFGSREDAWSETIRAKRWEWFTDDFCYRLKPGAKRILINTRWHTEDITGHLIEQIEHGVVRGKVIDIRAVAEEGEVDPIGRKPGEYLWDDDDAYAYGMDLRLKRKQSSPMAWAAMFQQRPAPEDGDYFKAEWLKPYVTAPDVERMRIYGASDMAVTADGGDFTVHAVAGLDDQGKLYLLDIWRRQTSSDAWVESFCDLVLKWKPMGWAMEKGQINSGVGPYLDRRQRERRAYVYREAFPTRGDKSVRAQSIRGFMASNGLYVPTGAPWFPAFRGELMAFPAGKHDDQCDALGLLGQLLDRMTAGAKPVRPVARARDSWDKVFGKGDSNVIDWKVA